jgi:hypothetical protein
LWGDALRLKMLAKDEPGNEEDRDSLADYRRIRSV